MFIKATVIIKLPSVDLKSIDFWLSFKWLVAIEAFPSFFVSMVSFVKRPSAIVNKMQAINWAMNVYL